MSVVENKSTVLKQSIDSMFKELELIQETRPALYKELLSYIDNKLHRFNKDEISSIDKKSLKQDINNNIK